MLFAGYLTETFLSGVQPLLVPRRLAASPALSLIRRLPMISRVPLRVELPTSLHSTNYRRRSAPSFTPSGVTVTIGSTVAATQINGPPQWLLLVHVCIRLFPLRISPAF